MQKPNNPRKFKSPVAVVRWLNERYSIIRQLRSDNDVSSEKGDSYEVKHYFYFRSSSEKSSSSEKVAIAM